MHWLLHYPAFEGLMAISATCIVVTRTGAFNPVITISNGFSTKVNGNIHNSVLEGLKSHGCDVRLRPYVADQLG